MDESQGRAISYLPEDITEGGSFESLGGKWIRVAKPRFEMREHTVNDEKVQKLCLVFDAVDLESGDTIEGRRYSVGPEEKWRPGPDGLFPMGIPDGESKFPSVSGNSNFGLFMNHAVAKGGLDPSLIDPDNIGWLAGMEILFEQVEIRGRTDRNGKPAKFDAPAQFRPASGSGGTQTNTAQVDVEATLVDFLSNAIKSGTTLTLNEVMQRVGSAADGPFKDDNSARTIATQIIGAQPDTFNLVLTRAGLRNEGGNICPLGQVPAESTA